MNKPALQKIRTALRSPLWNGRLAPVAALCDLARPDHDVLAQPLNGQARRREMIRELLRILACETIIETGTYHGATTRYFAELRCAEVISIEVVARFHWYARFRLRDYPSVRLLRGDSRSVLRSLSFDSQVTQRPTLFYLDAHWGDDLPLAGELREIARAWRTWIAVIDDFRVPLDPQYGYDDYGPGKTLDIAYLQNADIAGLRVFWPRCRAAEDTGLRRGCVVVTTSPPVAQALAARAETLLPQQP